MQPTSQPEPDSPPSVLETLGHRSGLASKVLLPDTGSEHGGSPVIAAGASTGKWTPKGRGNYQFLGEIARGGMGVILKGHDTDLGRDLAVKVLDSELAKNPAVVHRFIEEAQIGGQLQHPGIVPVYELGLMADESPYFTMKLVKGRTLSALFQQRKNVLDNRGRLLSIFESVCQTIAYAHSKGVLHRDLKPANIMVGAFGEVQVVDWGLAKVLHRGGVADERRAKETVHTVIETVRSGPGSSGSDSMVGSVMGTPAYMAPEQAQGEIEKLDERADVFSLGAILCELLTGRPPYEKTEKESVVVQAARGMLDPAKARIDACDADAALKRLCLDCLMPSRAARPANADEVARAVHEFLDSVEERAQKAELAAEKARIQAEEERRRRRLTIALGGTIGLALLLGGGGFWWVGRERARRTEQVRGAVEAAQSESLELGRKGQAAGALASARRALELAQAGGADTSLVEHARDFASKAEAAAAAAEQERAFAEQDETLRRRLVELRLRQVVNIGDKQFETELDKFFAQAFRDYGVDIEGEDVVPAEKRIRERAIAEDVALALDDWGRIRRRVYGASSVQAENLRVLALDLDPDPVRMRLREAIANGQLDVMLDLASRQNLPKLAPGSIWVLSAALWYGYPEHRPDCYRMYDQARYLYPNDYVLQTVGGVIYQLANRFEESLACRTSALSLRPNDVDAQTQLGEALFYLGRLTESEQVYRDCAVAQPANADAHYGVGSCLCALGDYAGALPEYQRSLDLREDPSRRPDLLAARFRTGLATREQIEHEVDIEVVAATLGTYMYALLDHADPAERDPAFVLRELAGRSTLFDNYDARFVVEAVARVRSGDWAGAQAALANHYALPANFLVSPAALEFLRSLVSSKLGQVDAARECHARAMVEWRRLTAADESRWLQSDVMRWRREAEAALAK